MIIYAVAFFLTTLGIIYVQVRLLSGWRIVCDDGISWHSWRLG